MAITIIDKIGDMKYTWSIDTAVANSTIIAEGVNALNRDIPRTIGNLLSLTS